MIPKPRTPIIGRAHRHRSLLRVAKLDDPRLRPRLSRHALRRSDLGRPAGQAARRRLARPLIYALSLGVYCTSWTYFGSVGIASRSGFDFLPIYIGPILVFAFGWPLLQRIAEIAKRHNIASIADFLAARYGKSEALGALVAAIAVIGIIPYISIQLKAVSQSRCRP